MTIITSFLKCTARFLVWFRSLVLSDTRATEFFSICFKLWWAFILATGDNVFSSNIVYAEFAKLGSEDQWTGLFLMLSAIHVAAMIFELHRVRRCSCFLDSLVWIFIAALILLSNPLSTGTGVYGIIAVASFWVFWAGPQDRPVLYIDKDKDGCLVRKGV